MKTTHLSRRAFLAATLAAGAMPLLQGCFPVVATGVGAGALMIADRRTSGAYIDDESIEQKASARMRENFGTLNHINITSYNRIVLLTGEVQNQEIRATAERLTRATDNVRVVINELKVAPASLLSARANDSLITSNVKGRFLDSKRFHANHVKVITEANVVFLMGLVTHVEADAASEIARTSKGVSKVVRVFEYLSEQDARRIDGVDRRTGSSRAPSP
jgi:osmotically-inducible protein OsmY